MQGGVFGGVPAPANKSNAGNYFDPRSLSGLQAMSHSDDPAVKRAALEEIGGHFEAILVNQMMDSMRNTTNAMFEDSLFNPQRVQFYQSMLDDQMSIELTGESGIGLANQFVANLSDRYGLDLEETPSPGHKPNFLETVRMVATVSPPQNSASQSSARNNKEETLGVEFIEANMGVQAPAAGSVLNETGGLSKSVREFLSGREPEDQASFVFALLPLAQRAGRELGVDPVDIIAQAALETGWGKQIIRNDRGENSYNLFGIKADSRWSGASINVRTTEYFDSRPISVDAHFRRYSSYEQSFDDFVQFLRNGSRYKTALEQAGNDFYRHLQGAGYATDPRYANKVNALSEQIQRDILAPAKLGQTLSQKLDTAIESSSRAQVVEKMAENQSSGQPS